MPPPKPLDLLAYHRPKRIGASQADREGRIPHLSAESKQCIRNLAAHQAKPLPFVIPRSRCAAVLVALFVGRSGDLRVLLNRRSARLRTYAGDTSLPGGKVEDGDKTIEDTARREAFEEIGLPIDRDKVPLLAILDPILAWNNLIVTPVVVLILDKTLQPVLNADEVASIFSHPLSGFFSSTPPFPSSPSQADAVPYHRSHEWLSTGPNNTQQVYRVHIFLTGREADGTQPITGLTAHVLINTAIVAYGREPDFEPLPVAALGMHQRIAWALWSNPDFRTSYDSEGINIDWDKIRRIAGVKEGNGVENEGKRRGAKL
uniref:Nudix hydrolase domain-containing protein n=1 Tax=Mycena chlorophos TaxID=658473 RepID=A0ABQ0LDJ3_MYCCL|nr:predicted protein [Mycena chlorophos]